MKGSKIRHGLTSTHTDNIEYRVDLIQYPPYSKAKRPTIPISFMSPFWSMSAPDWSEYRIRCFEVGAPVEI